MKSIVVGVIVLLFMFIFSVTTFACISEEEEFKYIFLKAAQNHEETVDIHELKLSESEVSKYMTEIFAEENVWFLECYCTLAFNEDEAEEGIVAEIILNYRVSQEEISEIEKLIEEAVDNIVILTEGYTDDKKIKIVYNYFMTNFDYDSSLENNDIYSLFKTKQGTCAALSLAYKEVLTRLDIPCEIVVNSDMTHEWNRVYIDNEWKNIDITRGLTLRGTVMGAENRAYLQSDAVLLAWGYSF